MSINLSSYKSIATGLFVKIELPTEVLRFSDFNQSVTIDGELYQGLGQFVGITTTTSELRSSSSEITITITGIPNTSISTILNAEIKGAQVTVLRAFFNPTTLAALSIDGNPTGRFFGIVNNYSLDEEIDMDTRQSSNTIAIICSSVVQILENKVAGRKTNPSSFKKFYPSDISMDRVPSLVNANFDFGIAK